MPALADANGFYKGDVALSALYKGDVQLWAADAGGGATAPTIRSASSMSNGNVRNWSIDVPAGVQAGDFLHFSVFVSSSSTPTITPPSGFAEIESITDFVANSRFSIFGKVAVGSYSAGAKFNGSFSVYNFGSVGACVAIIGSNNAENVAAHTSHATPSGSPITATAPSVTPSVEACLELVTVVAQNNGDYNDETDPFTFHDDLTKVIVAAHGDRALAIGSKALVSATATGDVTATITHAFGYRQSAWLALNACIGPA
jgi:hypothetical protein